MRLMMSSRSASSFDWAVVGALTLLAGFLRLYGLDGPLWFDEIVTRVVSLQGSFAETVTSYPSNNDHPLYSALAKLAMLSFGDTPFALRLPAAVFGTAAVPALYWLGLKVAPRREALAATVLMAVAYHAVWYGQNARGYTMMLFFALVSTGLLYDLARGAHPAPRRGWALYALCLALAAYTHLTMVLVGLTHGLVVLGHHLVTRRPAAAYGAAVLGFAGAGLITLILYAPMMGDLVDFFLGDSGAAAPSDPNTGGADKLSYGILATLYELSWGFGGPVPAAGAITVLGLGFLSYLRRAPLMTALFVMTVPVILGVAVALERPFFPRFFFFAAGFLLLLGVRGVAAILDWGLARAGRTGWSGAGFALAMAGATVISASALGRNYALPKQDYPAALALLQQDGAPVYVISQTSDLPFNRYLGQDWPRLRQAEQLTAALDLHDRIQVVYAFEKYIRLGIPALWDGLQTRCRPAHTIPSTVAGGEIHLLSCEKGGA